MKYESKKHIEFKKYGDNIIDGFIKWMIFNPNTFGTFLIFSLLGIVITTFLVIDIWITITAISFLVLLLASIIVPLFYLNETKQGKKLMKSMYYSDTYNDNILLFTHKTYYQAQYIITFPDEFEEND